MKLQLLKRTTHAIDDEIATIEKNNTWELVDQPELVAKGYSQQPGVDFNETFAPVAHMETIRTVLAVAAQMELQVFQLDVKAAFLSGELEEEVYVKQPPSYVHKGKEDKVYHLKKALYELKQALRAQTSKLDSYFQQNGFQRSPSEPLLYVKKKGIKDFLLVCLYVDNLIYVGKNPEMVAKFKEAIMKEYEMTNLGPMKYFLGIQVRQCKGEIFISQEKYFEDLLIRFQMNNCKLVSTPMAFNEKVHSNDGAKKVDARNYQSLVGSLIYLTNTRPDIVQTVSLISRFMNEPSKIHLTAAIRILCYLKGTKNLASNM